MPMKRVIRDGTSATLEVAFAITGKADAGSAGPFVVPPGVSRLVAIEVTIAAESLAAVQENNYSLRLQGDGIKDGPHYALIGGHSSGTTSTSGMVVQVTRVEMDATVIPGADIDVDGFAVGDTIIVANVSVALVMQ